MPQYDIRQDTTYRRGVVLGLTVAEIMILLIFVLLMALAAALSEREERLAVFEDGTASRLVEAIQEAYPEAEDPDDYFKELQRAIEARKAIEDAGFEEATEEWAEDADIGRKAREAAERAGAEDPGAFAEDVIGKAADGKKDGWPPFFSLSEAGGYTFKSGSAILQPKFRKNLQDEVIPKLAQFVREYDVDVLEVIGHTDEVSMPGSSNLDDKLIASSAGRVPIKDLEFADNAGLAIARATSVVRILRADKRLSGVTILPLSGAQLIMPVDRVADGSASGDDEKRRRIEIRLRRSTEQVTPGGREETGE